MWVVDFVAVTGALGAFFAGRYPTKVICACMTVAALITIAAMH